MSAPWISSSPRGVLVRLKAQPRASRTEIAGVIGDALKVRVTAPPVDNAANNALIAFLAKRTGRPRSAICLLKGKSSRLKVFAIQGLNVSDVESCLDGTT